MVCQKCVFVAGKNYVSPSRNRKIYFSVYGPVCSAVKYSPSRCIYGNTNGIRIVHFDPFFAFTAHGIGAGEIIHDFVDSESGKSWVQWKHKKNRYPNENCFLHA